MTLGNFTCNLLQGALEQINNAITSSNNTNNAQLISDEAALSSFIQSNCVEQEQLPQSTLILAITTGILCFTLLFGGLYLLCKKRLTNIFNILRGRREMDAAARNGVSVIEMSQHTNRGFEVQEGMSTGGITISNS